MICSSHKDSTALKPLTTFCLRPDCCLGCMSHHANHFHHGHVVSLRMLQRSCNALVIVTALHTYKALCNVQACLQALELCLTRCPLCSGLSNAHEPVSFLCSCRQIDFKIQTAELAWVLPEHCSLHQMPAALLGACHQIPLSQSTPACL